MDPRPLTTQQSRNSLGALPLLAGGVAGVAGLFRGLTMDAEKIAKSATVTAVARIGMIAASFALPIIVSIGGWMLNRAAGAADDISRKLDTSISQLSKLGWQVENVGDTIKDHENRIRGLERVGPPRPN